MVYTRVADLPVSLGRSGSPPKLCWSAQGALCDAQQSFLERRSHPGRAALHPAPESDGRMLHPGRGDARMAMPHTVSCPEQRAVAFLPPQSSSCRAGAEPRGAKSLRKWQFIQPDISQLKCPGLNKRSAPTRYLTGKAAGSSDPQPGMRVVLFQPKSDFNRAQSFSQLRACHVSSNGCECSRNTARGSLPSGDSKETALLSGLSSAFWQFL